MPECPFVKAKQLQQGNHATMPYKSNIHSHEVQLMHNMHDWYIASLWDSVVIVISNHRI